MVKTLRILQTPQGNHGNAPATRYSQELNSLRQKFNDRYDNHGWETIIEQIQLIPTQENTSTPSTPQTAKTWPGTAANILFVYQNLGSSQCSPNEFTLMQAKELAKKILDVRTAPEPTVDTLKNAIYLMQSHNSFQKFLQQCGLLTQQPVSVTTPSNRH